MFLTCINRKENLARERNDMLKCYLKELHNNYNLPYMSDTLFDNPYAGYFLNRQKYTEWIDIYDDNDNLVGFLIMATQPICHPDADYYIEESYIKPEHRNKGLMTKTVSEILDNKEGTFCFYVLKENLAAKRFWERVFKEHDYEKIELRDDFTAPLDYCTLYGYTKRKDVKYE